MLTKGTIIFLRRAVKLTNIVRSQPYKWSSKEGKDLVVFLSTRGRYWAYLAQLILFCTYQCFVFGRWAEAVFFDPTATTKRRVGLQYVSCAYSVPLVFQLITFFYYGMHHDFVNRILQHCRTFENRSKKLRKQRKCTSFMRKMYYAGLLVVTLNTVGLFRNPTKPHLLTSLLSDVKMRPKWQLIPFATLHVYIWLTQWSTMYFYAFIAITYSTELLNMLNCLQLDRDRQWKRQMDKFESFYMDIRMLQILHNNWNTLYRWVAASIEVVLVITCVFSFFGAVHIEGIRRLQLLLIATVALSILVAVWTKLGEIYETSKMTMQKWKSINSPRWFRMFLRSAPPLRVEVGRFFYVDRLLVLTLLGIIFTNTANLLLTV